VRIGWIRIAASVAAAALSLGTLNARADDSVAWLKYRRAHFAAFRAAHTHPEAEIAGIKARTAALIAEQPAPATPAAGLDAAPMIWHASNPPLELWDGPEYPELMADTHHDIGEACFTIEHGEYRLRGNRDYQHVGFKQSSNGPVGCVNWFDAQAYVAWLSKQTGRAYRLLSEAEYEYLNRAGTVTAYWWGEDIGINRTVCDGCGSAWDKRQLAVVGSFAPNAFGLYDTTGNSWSWLADCWNANYAGVPADGSAATEGDCDLHVMRGGGERSPAPELRSAYRSRHWFSLRNIVAGFRVAETS